MLRECEAGPGQDVTSCAVRSGLPAPALVAVVAAFVGLSLGSTIAKSVGAPGAVVAFWRFGVAAAVWHAVVAVRARRSGTPRVSADAWRVAALPGLAMGINMACFFTGVARTPVARAELVLALAPAVMVPLAALATGDRVPRPVVARGSVALVGVVLVLGAPSATGGSPAGDALVVGALAAWIGYLFAARAGRACLDTPVFMAVMSTTAFATTLPLAVVAADGPGGVVALTSRGWLLVVLLALVAGVIAHGLIAWAQHRVPVATITLVQPAQPALGTAWAALFLGEVVTPLQLVGIAVVVASIVALVRSAGP